jgi:hypothetical protein
MRRWCAYLSGVVLVAVAIAAAPSEAIITSYAGGSAVHGYVEDGHYFVNPTHGRPVVEVAESTWRAVYRVERVWPWSVLVPGLTGLFLVVSGMKPNRKPPPAPPVESPPWLIRACAVSAGVVVGGTLLCWYATRAPWATMLVGWILICVNGGTVAWLYTRFLRQQPTAEPGAAPDPAGISAFPDS